MLVEKRNNIKAKSRKLLSRFQQKLADWAIPYYTRFSIYEIITGLIVGLAAVFFHKTIHLLTELFFEYGKGKLVFLGGAAVIVIPVIGMLIQSLMTYLDPRTAKKKGVSEVIKAVAQRGGYIKFRTTLFHFLAPAINIGSGGTVGPEGPAAQLGGGLASKISQLLGLSDKRRRMFTAAGAGAAIAAVFNTPLGGIFFAIEIILLNDFHASSFSALILASVSASAVSRIFLGNESAFTFVHTTIDSYSDFYLYIILGVFAGLLSLAYIRYSDSVDHLFRKVIKRKIPLWLSMASVGLLVGVSGYFYKDIFGIGYHAINSILANGISWQVVLILLTLKFVLVPLILHSGGFGGVFAPTLFMGACFGYLFAAGMNSAFDMTLNPTVYTLVGMGAVLGGINTIPISSILIIFEMAKDYSFILPLMLAVVISTTIVQLVIKGSVHIKHLEAEGFSVVQGRRSEILKSIKVEEVMQKDVVLISEETPLPVLVRKLIDSHHGTFFTVDKDGCLTGAISENEIRPIITEYEQVKNVLIAKDIARKNIVRVFTSDDLDHVLKLFGSRNVDEFPVVSKEQPNKVIGTVWREDVIAAYNRESLKYNLADGLANELKRVDSDTVSEVAKGYLIVEKRVKPEFAGKTLSELKLRNKYGLEVLMIKRASSLFEEDPEETEIIVPKPDYVIHKNDILVLFGAEESIRQTQSW